MSALANAAPRGPLSAPVPPLVGPRRDEAVLVDVLDTDDQPVEVLDGVEGGSLDFNVNTEIRSSGSLTVARPGRVDWHRVRLAIRYEFTDTAGIRHVHPLGVFLPTTPSTVHGETGSTAEVELYDKMVMLSTDAAADTWTADAGLTVAQAVTAVLATIGEDDKVIAPQDGGGVLQDAMVWEPGTPKLKIINEILDAGYFFSIWVDGSGLWRLTPYVPPADRGVEWEHLAGFHAIFEPSVTHEEDTFEVPNQVIIVGRAEGDDGGAVPPLSAVAENNDPDDPLSIPSRGRVISLREDDQDATSESVLGQIAARRLLEVSSVTSTYQLSHAFVPLDLNAVERLRWPSRGIDALCTLQSWSWSWDAASVPGLVAATLREVRG